MEDDMMKTGYQTIGTHVFPSNNIGQPNFQLTLSMCRCHCRTKKPMIERFGESSESWKPSRGPKAEKC